MGERSPYDGRPYYCDHCGLGFGEYLACEDVFCKLEPPEAADSRRLIKLTTPTPLTDKDT